MPTVKRYPGGPPPDEQRQKKRRSVGPRPGSAEKERLRALVAEAIRTACARGGHRTQGDLARSLGIYPKHLSYWANGQWSRLDGVLIALLVENLRDNP